MNNASPIAVASIAALAASQAVEVLAGRFDEDVDLVDVYSPIEAEHFDSQGRLTFRRAAAR